MSARHWCDDLDIYIIACQPTFKDIQTNSRPNIKALTPDFQTRISEQLFQTALPYGRFAHNARTKHCWQNYVDYHKCILAKGEDFAPCRQVRNFDDARKSLADQNNFQFYHAYRSLCPSAWCERWDGQRGT